jgi:hypothetical protein
LIGIGGRILANESVQGIEESKKLDFGLRGRPQTGKEFLGYATVFEMDLIPTRSNTCGKYKEG